LEMSKVYRDLFSLITVKEYVNRGWVGR
jgi:hypothetical protein